MSEGRLEGERAGGASGPGETDVEPGGREGAGKRDAGAPPRLLVATAVAAVVLGVALRFTALDLRPLSSDEAYTGLRIAAVEGDEVRALLETRPPRTAADLLTLQQPREGKGALDVALSVARIEPHHGPLFFVLAHLWARVAGASARSLRALAALLSALALPAFYLLGRDLLGSRRAGHVTLALASLAPFLVEFSQDARPHGLAITLFVWCTWALVRAVGSEASRAPWVAYALLLAAGTNTYPAFLLGVPAHVAFVLASAPTGARRRAALRLLAACAGGGVLILPWAVNAALLRERAVDMLEWKLEATSGLMLLRHAVVLLAELRLDLGNPPGGMWPLYVLPFAAGLPLAGAIVTARRRAPAALLGITLAAVFPAFLLLDAVRDWRTSITPRHMFVAIVGAEVLSAAAIAGALGATRAPVRLLGAGALAAALGMGIVSGVTFVRARQWWTAAGFATFSILKPALEGEPRSAIILARKAEAQFLAEGWTLGVARDVPPTTLLIDLRRGAAPPPLDGVARIALWGPAPEIAEGLIAAGFVRRAEYPTRSGARLEIYLRRPR